MLRKRFRNPSLQRVLAFLFVITAPWYFCNSGDFEPHPLQHLMAFTEIPALKNVLGSDFRLSTHIVKQGDSFSNILLNFKVPSQTIAQYSQLLRTNGLQNLSIGDSIIVHTNPDEKLTICSILNNGSCWYHLYTNTDGTATIDRRPTQLSTYTCVLKGKLTSTFANDLFKQGITDGLIYKLADIFAWDINFFTDPQVGDSFVIVFEKRYLEGKFIDYGSVLAAKYSNGPKDYYAFGFQDKNRTYHYFDHHGKPLKKQFLKSPVRLSKLTSQFTYNRLHPIFGVRRPHLGVDLAAPVGTPVYAAADGNIVFLGTVRGYGKQIRIDHGAAVETYYGHLHAFAPGLKNSQRVKQGDLIGTVGSTGDATGPHLDYRMKMSDDFIDPIGINAAIIEDYVINGDNVASFEEAKQTYISIFENRLNRPGCFVLDISEPAYDNVLFAKNPLSGSGKS